MHRRSSPVEPSVNSSSSPPHLSLRSSRSSCLSCSCLLNSMFAKVVIVGMLICVVKMVIDFHIFTTECTRQTHTHHKHTKARLHSINDDSSSSSLSQMYAQLYTSSDTSNSNSNNHHPHSLLSIAQQLHPDVPSEIRVREDSVTRFSHRFVPPSPDDDYRKYMPKTNIYAEDSAIENKEDDNDDDEGEEDEAEDENNNDERVNFDLSLTQYCGEVVAHNSSRPDDSERDRFAPFLSHAEYLSFKSSSSSSSSPSSSYSFVSSLLSRCSGVGLCYMYACLCQDGYKGIFCETKCETKHITANKGDVPPPYPDSESCTQYTDTLPYLVSSSLAHSSSTSSPSIGTLALSYGSQNTSLTQSLQHIHTAGHQWFTFIRPGKLNRIMEITSTETTCTTILHDILKTMKRQVTEYVLIDSVRSSVPLLSMSLPSSLDSSCPYTLGGLKSSFNFLYDKNDNNNNKKNHNASNSESAWISSMRLEPLSLSVLSEFSPHYFDTIIMHDVLSAYQSSPLVLPLLYLLLKPGGQLILYEKVRFFPPKQHVFHSHSRSSSSSSSSSSPPSFLNQFLRFFSIVHDVDHGFIDRLSSHWRYRDYMPHTPIEEAKKVGRGESADGGGRGRGGAAYYVSARKRVGGRERGGGGAVQEVMSVHNGKRVYTDPIVLAALDARPSSSSSSASSSAHVFTPHFYLNWNRGSLSYWRYHVVDSVFRFHPLAVIHVFTPPNALKPNTFANFTERGYKVYIHHFNIDEFLSDTPAAVWAKQDFTLPQHQHAFASHKSDAFRLAIVWKYGGVYLDFDYLLLKPLTNLRNFMAEERPRGFVNGAILVGDSGHPYLQLCLTQLPLHHDINVWVSVGPGLLTKTMELYEMMGAGGNNVRGVRRPMPSEIDGQIRVPNRDVGGPVNPLVRRTAAPGVLDSIDGGSSFSRGGSPLSPLWSVYAPRLFYPTDWAESFRSPYWNRGDVNVTDLELMLKTAYGYHVWTAVLGRFVDGERNYLSPHSYLGRVVEASCLIMCQEFTDRNERDAEWIYEKGQDRKVISKKQTTK